MKTKQKSHSVYFASELFSVKHLIGNAYLAEAIYEKSHGRFLCRLPHRRFGIRTSVHFSNATSPCSTLMGRNWTAVP